MGECKFKHIPSRLLWGQSPICKFFFYKEELYWRSKNYKKQYEQPYKYFDDVSLLIELSVNRSGLNNSISIPNDVLYCIDESKEFSIYPDTHPIVMTNFNSPCDVCNFVFNGYNVEVKLEHDPLPCNYAHSMFRTYFDGCLISREKFDELELGHKKKGKKYRKSMKDIFNKLTIASVA
ncbi:MAG: hypothetical protein ACWA41_12750 [Putridiphycobacter sp.]